MMRRESFGNSRQTRRATTTRIVLLIALSAILLAPIYWMIVTAISPLGDILTSNPKIFPDLSTLSFDNFVRAFQTRPLGRWMANSIFVAAATTIIVSVLATMAGYGLSRSRGRAGSFVGVSLFGVRLIPTTLLVIPFYIMFADMNLRNNLFSLVIANTIITLPFAVWIMKSVYDAIPEELEEAAMVDGSSRFGGFIRIVLPMATGGIGSVAIFTAISAWSDFAFARTLVQGDQNSTITVGLVGFIGEYTVDWGGLMAAGLISVLPMVILFIILEPLIVSGLTRGALK